MKDKMKDVQLKSSSVSAFQAVGDQVQQLDSTTEEAEQRLVEEIESFCVNCEQNVRASMCSAFRLTCLGHNEAPSHQDSLLP